MTSAATFFCPWRYFQKDNAFTVIKEDAQSKFFVKKHTAKQHLPAFNLSFSITCDIPHHMISHDNFISKSEISDNISQTLYHLKNSKKSGKVEFAIFSYNLPVFISDERILIDPITLKTGSVFRYTDYFAPNNCRLFPSFPCWPENAAQQNQPPRGWNETSPFCSSEGRQPFQSVPELLTSLNGTSQTTQQLTA